MSERVEIKNLREQSRLKDKIIEYLFTHGYGPRGDWCSTKDITLYFGSRDPMFEFILCDALADENRVEFKNRPPVEEAMKILDNPDPLKSRIKVRATQLALKEKGEIIKAALDETNLKNIRPLLHRSNLALVIALFGLLITTIKTGWDIFHNDSKTTEATMIQSKESYLSPNKIDNNKKQIADSLNKKVSTKDTLRK